MNKQELLIISQDAQLVLGALGDLEGCNARIEELKLDGEQGYLTKYWGIKTPYNGWIDQTRIDKCTITKRAIYEYVKSFPFALLLRKKLLNFIHRVCACDGGVRDWRLADNEFCPAVRELIRAAKKIVFQNKFWLDIVYSLAMFIQFSGNYKFWLQDIFGELNKEYFQKHPLTEILRLKRIFMNRLQLLEPSRTKMEMMWRGLIVFVSLNRKIAKAFIKELDISKVKLDDQDWYYVLRKSSYDFGGKSLFERVAKAAITDDENKNIILYI